MSVWFLQGAYPLEELKPYVSLSRLYFLIRSQIASSSRSFWRLPIRAASILIRLINSVFKVVLYIFLFPISIDDSLDQSGLLEASQARKYNMNTMAIIMNLIIGLNEPPLRPSAYKKTGPRLSKTERLMGISFCGVKRGAQ